MDTIYRTIDLIEEVTDCRRSLLFLLLVVAAAFPWLFLSLLAALVTLGVVEYRADAAQGRAP